MREVSGIRRGLLISLVALMASCGGGGGSDDSTNNNTPPPSGGNPDPPGQPPGQPGPGPDPNPNPNPDPNPAPEPELPVINPSPVTIDEGNLPTFVSLSLLPTLIGISSEAVTDTYFGASPGTGLVSVNQNGCSGTVSFIANTSDRPQTGAGSYSAYDNCAGLRLDGTFAGEGVYLIAPGGGQDVVRLDLSFSQLSLNLTSDNSSYKMSGTMKLRSKPSISLEPPGYTVSIDAYVLDANNRPVLALKDFVLDAEQNRAGSQWIAYEGRISHPELGYADAATLGRLTYQQPYSAPSLGRFALLGANQQATVEYAGGAYTSSFGPLPPFALDAAFGTHGVLTTDFGDTTASLNFLAQQPDGKLVAAGNANGLTLTRYNVDGSLDTSFANGGKLQPSHERIMVRGLGVLPDGKLIVATSTEFAFRLIRYLPDGQIDSAFGNGGTIEEQVIPYSSQTSALRFQPDGQIVVAAEVIIEGTEHFVVGRFHPDGRLDESFGVGGTVRTPLAGSSAILGGLIIQPDGKVLVGGSVITGSNSWFELVRYNPDGSFDPTFGTGGRIQTATSTHTLRLTGLALQPDGKVVAAGEEVDLYQSTIMLARFSSSGELDPTFGTNGVARKPFNAISRTGSLALLEDGKLLMTTTAAYGVYDRFAVLRFDSTGALDSAFWNGQAMAGFGKNVTTLSSMLIQPDGNIVTGGTVGGDFALARFAR